MYLRYPRGLIKEVGEGLTQSIRPGNLENSLVLQGEGLGALPRDEQGFMSLLRMT